MKNINIIRIHFETQEKERVFLVPVTALYDIADKSILRKYTEFFGPVAFVSKFPWLFTLSLFQFLTISPIYVIKTF